MGGKAFQKKKNLNKSTLESSRIGFPLEDVPLGVVMMTFSTKAVVLIVLIAK